MKPHMHSHITSLLCGISGLMMAAVLAFALAAPAQAAEMKDYCIVPPYVKSGLKPNILILMDNSEKNGGPAYTEEGDPTIIHDALTGLMLYNAATTQASGLFRDKIWYKYDGKMFVPTRYTDDPTSVFEGNLLNWVSTSMYDIITSVIVGGKSASRQTNAHTLSSYATGNWNPKAYIYREEGSCVVRACSFRVVTTDAQGARLVISDIKEYLEIDSSYTCGLIGATPKRPAPEYTFDGYTGSSCPDPLPDFTGLMGPDAPGGPDAPASAAASPAPESTGGAEGVILGTLYRAINGIMGLIAGEAEAAPLKVAVPFKDNITYDVNMYEAYQLTPTASGGSGYYSWSLSASTPLPTGMIFNTVTGKISGAPTDFSQVGQHSITITVIDTLDPTTTSNRTLILSLAGVPLRVFQPSEGGTIHDALWDEEYTGYYPVAVGGTGNYVWSIVGGSLPPDLTMNPATGYISGFHTPPSRKTDLIEYDFQLKVSDGYSTALSNASIISRGATFELLPLPGGSTPPDAIMEEEYQGFKYGAVGGTGVYTWAADLPAGLSINETTGFVSGIPEIQGEGTYLATVIVNSMAGTSVVESITLKDIPIKVVRPGWMDVKITWPDPNYGMNSLTYGYMWGSVQYGQSYPIDLRGWRDAFAQGGDSSKYNWTSKLQPGSIYNSLSDVGMAIDAATGMIYTPVGNPYKSIPGHPEALLPDSMFPGYVTQANKWVTIVISVTDDSSSDDIYVYFAVHNNAPGTTIYSLWPPDSINWTMAPPAYVGKEYSGAGTTTYLGYLTQRCQYYGLPAGMTGRGFNCTIDGTPASGTIGFYKVQIRVSNAYEFGTHNWYWMGFSVSDPSPVSIKIPAFEGADLANATEGRYYEFQPVALGGEPLNATGTPQYSWTIIGLPFGLGYNSSTGLINGVPKQKGIYSLTITAHDIKGRYATRHVDLYVSMYDKASFANLTPDMYLPEGTEGKPYQGFSVVGTGGLGGAYKFYANNPTSPLPTGLTINVDTGLISGTPAPNTDGVWTVYITVEDAFAKYPDYSKSTIDVKLVINKAAASAYSEEFLTDICNGDYDNNCNGGDPPGKHGLLQDYWDFASFGFENFNKSSGDAEIATCMPSTNQPSFFTDVQNALPVGSLTELINGEYKAVEYFINLKKTLAATGGSCNVDMFPEDTTSCQKNYVLMLTSGEGADRPLTSPKLFTDTSHATEGLSVPVECNGLNYDLSKNACFGFAQDIRPDESGTDLAKKGEQRVSSYFVHTMGINADILKEAAAASEGKYYYASNATEIKEKLEAALKDMIKKASAGSAASVLASGEGSGANIVQAIYYPKKRFWNNQENVFDEIMWTGKLSAFWYYTDPYLVLSDIREETNQENPPQLNLGEDYVIKPFYNSTTLTVDADRYADTDGDGDGDNYVNTISFDELPALWEAGKLLWKRDLDAQPRTIYTNLDDSAGMTLFNASTVTSNSLLRDYMQTPEVVNAVAIANFINGYDVPGKRDRLVTVDLNSDGLWEGIESQKRVWKLGDILDSTPRLTSARKPLNLYHGDYCDATYLKFFKESPYYSTRGMAYAGGNDGMLHAFKLGYIDRNVTPEGDIATLFNSPTYANDINETPLGFEKWAFIPKHVLPFLKYTAENNYCHIYLVDQSVQLVDVSLCESTWDNDAQTGYNEDNARVCAGTNTSPKDWDSWRTILIGGMRYGGGCKPATYTCTMDTNGDGTVDDTDCLRVPTNVGGKDIGYSSYFALDITKEDDPVFMWEYANSAMGHSTSGPAVVRVNGVDGGHNTLGHWYVVFGSGPTGPVDETAEQYIGASDQSLKFFVLDIKTGQRPAGMSKDYIEPVVPVQNAYVHTMGMAMSDFGLADLKITDAGGLETVVCPSPQGDYETDALFIGYTKKCESGDALQTGAPCPERTWRNGGVMRILTGNDPNPDNWNVRPLIENIGPVFSAPDYAWNPGLSKVRVAVGTGRYFYEREEPWITTGELAETVIADDRDTIRQMIVVDDPCTQPTDIYQAPYGNRQDAKDCDDPPVLLPTLDLRDHLGELNPNPDCDPYIYTFDAGSELEPEYYQDGTPILKEDGSQLTYGVGAERVKTNIKIEVNTATIFATTFKPYTNQCQLGGKTHIYAFDLCAGTPKSRQSGIIVMQLSTGIITKTNRATEFTQMEGLRTSGTPGLADTEGGLIPDRPGGTGRLLHILERKQ